ncbi:MAG TPA: dienelactone hydrolase family protein, partial [Sphingomicrobium sp.]|nr:dienelactone hydrolase family protein [Sphingomicrobium sp.]
MDDELKQEAILLYDRFTHEGLDRRLFMGRMVALAGSAAAAEALIASIAASPAAAAVVPTDDTRLTTRTQDLAGGYKAYVAEPRTRSLKATIVVIHENRGLNDHIRDVARRLGVAGFRAVAPDFLSPSGGTPANEDAARDAIGKLDLGKSVSDAVAILDELSKSSRGGKVGAVGFCWGGGFVNRLAVAAGDELDAGVSYYGPAPDASEAAKVQSPLLIHDAGLDDRVNRTSFPWVEALRAAGKPVK